MQFWVDLSDGFTGSSLCSIKAYNFNKMEENLTAIKTSTYFLPDRKYRMSLAMYVPLWFNHVSLITGNGIQ